MGGTTVDFSGRDYTAILERLQTKLIEEVPELTDLNYSDAGQFLLRRLASESEYIHWYIDEAFYENFIATAEQRQSLINLATLVDWKITLPTSASTTLTLTRKTGVTGNISIPRYQPFTKTDETSFVLNSLDDAEYILESAVDTINVPILQGVRYTYTIREEEFEEHELTGLLRYSLGTDIASGSVRLFNTSDSSEWEEVDTFWRTTSSDQSFSLQYESDPELVENDSCYLVLGSIGFPSGDTLACSFNRTLGSLGNTGAGTIINVSGSLDNSVTCSNLTSATGGSDIETITSLKNRIPQAVRTQRRCVTVEDYEATLQSVPGVRFCQAIDRNNIEELPHLYVKLYVVPYGGYTISEQLRNTILAELADKGALGDWSGRYLITEATQYVINITARIGVLSGHNSSTVISNLTSKLNTYLTSDTFGIGDGLDFGDLNIYAGRQTGVSWIEFDSPDADIVGVYGYIITPGTISITVQS